MSILKTLEHFNAGQWGGDRLPSEDFRGYIAEGAESRSGVGGVDQLFGETWGYNGVKTGVKTGLQCGENGVKMAPKSAILTDITSPANPKPRQVLTLLTLHPPTTHPAARLTRLHF